MSQVDRKKIFTDEDIKSMSGRIPKWEATQDGLKKTFEFVNFEEAFNFMTKVAAIAEDLDHHPDWSNSWNKVDIAVVNHQAGGVTEIDFVLCEKIDELFGA